MRRFLVNNFGNRFVATDEEIERAQLEIFRAEIPQIVEAALERVTAVTAVNPRAVVTEGSKVVGSLSALAGHEAQSDDHSLASAAPRPPV